MRVIFCLLFLAALTARAAPLERDLGQGLAYGRVHRLPADLPGVTEKKPRALVLDLRWATGDSAGATALDAWLKFRVSAASPVLLLVNRATATAVAEMLAARGSAAGLVTIGAASDKFTPDIAIDTAPEAERTAYDALEHGAAVDALISDRPDEKPRHDEAELARQHRNPAPVVDDSDSPESAPAEKQPPPPPPVTDRALQRAMHLHRALVALRRLPPG